MVLLTGAVFDELSDDELREARQSVGDCGLDAARALAAERLAAGPAAGVGDPGSLLELLMSRDTTDSRWELVAAFEVRWALLVVLMSDSVLKDPSAAVADARRRGATWPAIARTLGVSTQAVHGRFRGVRDKDA